MSGQNPPPRMMAVALLREDASKERVYRTSSVYCDAVGRGMADFEKKYPGGVWNDYGSLVSGVPGQGEYELAVKHLVQWGKGDASLLEAHWGIRLPDWIHEFYAQVSEAVLLWRNCIRILHPREIIQIESEQREWDEAQDLPVRLIRFSTIWVTGAHFAFRQSVSDDKWRIMYVCDDYEERTADYQDASMDDHVDDEDLAAWFKRMIATDGFPICRGHEEHEKLFVERVR